MLSQNDIDLVKQTIPLLETAGATLTDHFYKRMFRDHPELKNVFNLSHQHSGKQPVALFNAVAAYAKHIENPDTLKAAVTRIAHKHTSFDIQPNHYDIVGHHLIGTLNELAGEAFTPEIESAWTKAYEVLANIFIDTEANLYHQSRTQNGGWQGTRKFRLIDKRIESELVKTFVFAPVDKEIVRDYLPGQYIGLKLDIPNHPFQEIRQYSLSAKPNGKTYQISVKREQNEEPGAVPGIVSNYLHDSLKPGDEVDILPPAGDFHFIDKQRPVVLISAGVGLTPMTAILDTLTSLDYEPEIHFIHACETREQHSFRSLKNQTANKNNIHHYTWYRSDELDEEGTFHGLLDLTLIEHRLPVSEGDFYLCGPVPFMQFTKQQLLNLGTESSRIHYEVFGPHESI